MPANPVAELAHRRRLRQVIEELAADCLANALPYRPALAQLSATGPTDRVAWAEACWSAGCALADQQTAHLPAELRDSGRYNPANSKTVFVRAAGYLVCNLLTAATAGEREAFDRLCEDLFAEPAVVAEVPYESYMICGRLDHLLAVPVVQGYARRYRVATGLPTWGAESPNHWDGPPALSDTARSALEWWERADEQGSSIPWPELVRWWPATAAADVVDPSPEAAMRRLARLYDPSTVAPRLPDGPFDDPFRCVTALGAFRSSWSDIGWQPSPGHCTERACGCYPLDRRRHSPRRRPKRRFHRLTTC